MGSSPDGLTPGRGAKEARPNIGPNEIAEKKTNEILKFMSLFLGSDPLDDRSGGDPLGGGAALAGLRRHPKDLLLANAPGRITGKSIRQATPSPL